MVGCGKFDERASRIANLAYDYLNLAQTLKISHERRKHYYSRYHKLLNARFDHIRGVYA
jgi:hypothetical protein